MYEYRLRYNMAKRDKNDTRTAEQRCKSFTWRENGILKSPRVHIAEMALDQSEEEERKILALNKLMLDVGCGSRMPGQQPRLKRRTAGRPDEVKVSCKGVEAQNKPCGMQIYQSHWTNGFCSRHQKQAPGGAIQPQPS